MANLLTPSALLAINAALKSVVDTFFRTSVTLNLRTTTPGRYGEKPTSTSVPHQFDVLIDYSVGKSGRYEDVDKTDLGQRSEDSFRIFFWRDDVENAGITVDPEADTVTITGVPGIKDQTFEIRLFVPSASFSDLGYRFYEMEVKAYGS